MSAAKSLDANLFLAGRNLAVLAVNELQEVGSDACSIEADHRQGRTQCDVLCRAIDILRTAPPSVVAGFAAVLTDMMGCECVPPVEHYSQLTPEEMGIHSGEWTASVSTHSANDDLTLDPIEEGRQPS